jgi:addiction module RelE/StbE family toxin
LWLILEHRRLDKQLAKLPTELLKRYEKWKDIAEFSGPQGLMAVRGFRDEALTGEWSGYRSSRLNQQYRVIYRMQDDRLEIRVVEVVPHDYRRRK